MDSGFCISSEKSRTECHHPVRDVSSGPYIPPLHSSSYRTTSSSRRYGDRFIPNRAAMDMDIAQYLLTEPTKDKENKEVVSPVKEAYRKLLADTMLKGRTRILSFHNKPPAPVKLLPDIPSWTQIEPGKKRRHIPRSPEQTLDAPELVDDYYLNLLDWGSSNVLSIALGNTVFLWNATNKTASELVTIDEHCGPVTSVSWAPDGYHIAIGLNSSEVQLWDSTKNKLIRNFRGIHQHGSRVGSLAWNNNILTTGGMDGAIVNNDVRARDHNVSSIHAHFLQVCGLRWSGSGKYLASGGCDEIINIWDLSTWNAIHRFTNHKNAVKALAWSPFQSNLLASGGGENDRCIKFWNVDTGTCLNSVNTGSRVCSLLWNQNEREILSSHGYTENQLTLWRYPSMTKMAELTGNSSPVLFNAQSPDGCTVASASTGDESLRFWNVFGVPEVRKPAPKSSYVEGPSNMYSHIR